MSEKWLRSLLFHSYTLRSLLFLILEKTHRKLCHTLSWQKNYRKVATITFVSFIPSDSLVWGGEGGGRGGLRRDRTGKRRSEPRRAAYPAPGKPNQGGGFRRPVVPFCPSWAHFPPPQIPVLNKISPEVRDHEAHGARIFFSQLNIKIN